MCHWLKHKIVLYMFPFLLEQHNFYPISKMWISNFVPARKDKKYEDFTNISRSFKDLEESIWCICNLTTLNQGGNRTGSRWKHTLQHNQFRTLELSSLKYCKDPISTAKNELSQQQCKTFSFITKINNMIKECWWVFYIE